MINSEIEEELIIHKKILYITMSTADLHAHHLSILRNCIQPLMPLNEEKILAFRQPDYANTDAFVMRFIKLQDLMGTKLFGLVLDWADEGPYVSFLDKLYALEKLGCVTDAQSWIKVRELRNFLSHDYPDNYERVAKFFNQAYDLAPFLMLTLDNLKKYSEETTKRKGEFLR